EDHRRLWHGKAALLGVVAIVQPDADEFSRPRHRREPVRVLARYEPSFLARVGERIRIGLEAPRGVARSLKPPALGFEPIEWIRRTLARREQLFAIEALSAVLAVGVQNDAHAGRLPVGFLGRK